MNERIEVESGKRVTFPEDEARHEWLPRLLDAYAIADAGVAEGIRREESQGRKLACGRGCAACCRSHQTIPVYPLELVGLSWFVTEKVEGGTREKLKAQLRDFKEGDPCPFLVDEVCSVHPLRPMACRQFNVFGQVCAEGEDAFYTRREDVLTPLRRYVDEALLVTLPFYGVKKKSDQKRAIQSGQVHQLAKVLQECNWTSLAERMEAWGKSHS